MRPIRVLVTMKDGEHRIHLRGDDDDVMSIASVSGGFFAHMGNGAGGRDTVRSGPESDVKILWHAWSSPGCKSERDRSLVSQVFSQLKREARVEHLRQHPECTQHWPAP